MVKNLPCNAGDEGSVPGQITKILPAEEQLSLRVPQIESLGAATRILHDPVKNLHATTKIRRSQ